MEQPTLPETPPMLFTLGQMVRYVARQAMGNVAELVISQTHEIESEQRNEARRLPR